MSCFSPFILLVFLAVASGAVKQLPKDFIRCSRKDPHLSECLRRAFHDTGAKLRDGIPKFKLPPMDPLSVTRMSMEQGSGPVSLDLTFHNVTLSGILKKYEVLDAYLDYDRHFMNATFFFETAVLESDYEMKGQVLVLPIRGAGKSKFVMTNTTAVVTLSGAPKIVDGRMYNEVKEYTMNMAPKHMSMHFENLFNGDKRLGDTTNRFINENWSLIYEEIKPTLNEGLGIIYKEFANKIFLSVPYEDIFPLEL